MVFDGVIFCLLCEISIKSSMYNYFTERKYVLVFLGLTLAISMVGESNVIVGSLQGCVHYNYYTLQYL